MRRSLALWGGEPIRRHLLPYGRQHITPEDIECVSEVLQSDWITTGPEVGKFEEAFAAATGCRFAVAVSSGTAALHAAVHAAGIQPGDEVVVPAITFVATANCVAYAGASPVFADVEPNTLNLDIDDAASKITPKTRAIIGVDYAGQPCNYRSLNELAGQHGLTLIDDACHALGASYAGNPVGSLADLSTFSLHPVKPITSGEGGVVTTDDKKAAEKIKSFRNHGISRDHHQRSREGTWSYEMTSLGFNYRITDFQCALGRSQLEKLSGWVARRQEIARQYESAFLDLEAVEPLTLRRNVSHAFHLYVVKLNLEYLACDRGEFFSALRAEGIGVNVHYLPVYLHPFYRSRYGTQRGLCPTAEAVYERILSLPLYPGMDSQDVEDVIRAVFKVARAYRA